MSKDEALKGAIGAEYQKSPWDGKGISMPPPAAPVQEPVAIYQYQLANGSWIDQDKFSYDYNVRLNQATVRVVYTTPPAAPDLQAELDATNRQVEILSDALAESRREIDALVALARADERDKWMERAHIMILGEREACAKLIESHGATLANGAMLADAIRARGNT